tara:strand:- start:139 stop:270 length:132 start_codon:yes stop_codon:yes gene_type:complete
MILDIIFGVAFFGLVFVLLSGAYLIVQDKEREYQERRNQRDNK